MQCINKLGAGRCVITTRRMSAGEEFFSEYFYAIGRRIDIASPKRIVCSGCASTLDSKGVSTCAVDGEGRAPFSCRNCGASFCDHSCFSKWLPSHLNAGECAAIAAATRYASCVAKEDYALFELVIATLAKCKTEGNHGLLQHAFRKRGTEVETTGLNPLPMDKLTKLLVEQQKAHEASYPPSSSSRGCSCVDTKVSRPMATYAAVEALTTNRSTMSKFFPNLIETYSLHHKVYTNMLHERCASDAAGWWQKYLPQVSEDVYISLCCAAQCNAFGIWNTADQLVGEGFFPFSSFFNHSCHPNIARKLVGRRSIFYAIRPINEGDELCYSYISLDLPREARQSDLLDTYGFKCTCKRCSAAQDSPTDVAMCTTCSRIMQPVRGDGKCSSCGYLKENACVAQLNSHF